MLENVSTGEEAIKSMLAIKVQFIPHRKDSVPYQSCKAAEVHDRRSLRQSYYPHQGNVRKEMLNLLVGLQSVKERNQLLWM
jgi:hypothetical protein